MAKKEYFELAAILDSLKNQLKHGQLAPDEVQEALLQEGYSETKSKELVNKWIEQNPMCGFEKI